MYKETFNKTNKKKYDLNFVPIPSFSLSLLSCNGLILQGQIVQYISMSLISKPVVVLCVISCLCNFYVKFTRKTY